MNEQQRTAMQQAQAYIRWTAFGECRSPWWDGAPPMAAEADLALVQALAEPARTLAEPVTEAEVKAALAANELPPNGERLAMMRRALEGFAAGRAAGVGPAVVPEGWQLVPVERLLHAKTNAQIAIDSICQGAKKRPDLMCGWWDTACTHAEISLTDLDAMLAAAPQQVSSLPSTPQPAAQPAVVESGWIGVDERLPEKWQEVMVWPHPTDYCMTGQFEGAYWTYADYGNWGHDDVKMRDPTHWMPMPPPPATKGKTQ